MAILGYVIEGDIIIKPKNINSFDHFCETVYRNGFYSVLDTKVPNALVKYGPPKTVLIDITYHNISTEGIFQYKTQAKEWLKNLYTYFTDEFNMFSKKFQLHKEFNSKSNLFEVKLEDADHYIYIIVSLHKVGKKTYSTKVDEYYHMAYGYEEKKVYYE